MTKLIKGVKLHLYPNNNNKLNYGKCSAMTVECGISC